MGGLRKKTQAGFSVVDNCLCLRWSYAEREIERRCSTMTEKGVLSVVQRELIFIPFFWE